jgi:hypothetical protein
MSCQAGRRCGVGVVGRGRGDPAGSSRSWCGVSGRLLERVGVVGDTPVRESTACGLDRAPE